MARRATRTASKSPSHSESKGAASQAAVHADTTQPSVDAIARRAYELFQLRGGTHGHALEDWLQAEHELSSRQSLN